MPGVTGIRWRAQSGHDRLDPLGVELGDQQQISGGRVRLRAGTLYTALERLRADELIAVDREEIVENRLRRYYRLTPKGSGLLAEEAVRLQANAAAALARLNPAGGMA